MNNAYNKIFWGIFIATFNINIGGIKILPSFIGFLIVLSGLDSLYKDTHIEAFNKAKNFAIITVVISIVGGITNILSIELINYFIFGEILTIINFVMEILLFYKYFEGSIEYFNSNDYTDIAGENTRKLRFYIIVSLISTIVMVFALIFNITYLTIIIGIVFIILRIYLMVSTHYFKQSFTEES